jgi:hypothetical protein
MIKDKGVFRADMYVRFAQNHRLDMTYYDLSRDSFRVIDRTIQYGDETFLLNTSIKSEFNLTIMKSSCNR